MVPMQIYGVLAALELVLVISIIAVFLFLRYRKGQRELQALQGKYDQQRREAEELMTRLASQEAPAAPEPEPSKDYSDFLQGELDSSSTLLGQNSALDRDALMSDDEDAVMRQVMAARHQFLKMELDSQALADDPDAQRQHMLENMRSLMMTLAPDPEIREVPSDITDEAVAAREKQLQEQIESLRNAINNQYEVMRDLKKVLQDHLGDTPEAHAVMAQLEAAEAQSHEMESKLKTMTSPSSVEYGGKGKGKGTAAAEEPDTDMLRDLVGNQQNTIEKLKHMLAAAIPDAEAAEGLKQAVDKVQRANQELGTCVMVLEDENSRLRTEVETLQTRMQDFEESENNAAASAPAPAPAEAAETEVVAEATEEPDQAESVQTEDSADAQPEAAAEESEDLSADEFLELGASEEDSPEAAQAAEPATSDDIDALLEDISEPTPEADDIDALLESVGEQPAADKASTDSESESVDAIDALLDEVAAQDDSAATAETDDIDALLESVGEQPAAEAPSAAAENENEDDIDALLESIDATPAAEEQAPATEEKPADNGDVDDIDALLEEISGTQDKDKQAGT